MEKVIVCKFGGSSLADAQQFKKVKDIILSQAQRKFVIPSAPGKGPEGKHKVTDLLLMCYQLVSHGLNFEEVYQMVRQRFLDIRNGLNLDIRIEEDLDQIYQDIQAGASQDYCASRGEYLNGLLLSEYLGFEFIDPSQFIYFDKNRPKIKQDYMDKILESQKSYVIPGFYGAGPDGQIKTLSRGGSDVTGALVAQAVNAQIYENWTDVSGVLVADPKIVPQSQIIEEISYKELRELSYMGASVLHEEAVFPVRKKEIPIRILNTNQPDDPGTLITSDKKAHASKDLITGIAGKKDYTVIRVEKTHMSEDLSFYRKLLSVFEANDIQIEHMPTSVDTVSIMVASSQIESKLKKVTEEIAIYCDPDDVVINKDLAIIAVVGRAMVNTRGSSAQLFTALADAGINIRMISQGSGELNIIVGVNNQDFEPAIQAIYKKFKE